MWHVSYYIADVPLISQHYLFNCTYHIYATNCMEKKFHPNTAVAMPGMDSANMK